MGAARVGKTLGNFRILECLGSGGSGMIWKAEDLSLGRMVALKALRSELAADAEMSQRFRDEARALAKLSHANIASLYSLIEDDDGLFLVLEYVEGNTLAALLATSGPLPLESAYALFHQVLDGVGHAHEMGVVHRDLKPANLMVDARGRVKVMDFGIARVVGAARTTHHGKLVGTPEYMSPEQVRGEDATIRSDIYSLGALLFEMVTGQPPFRGSASFELMRAQIEDAPPKPRALRPDLDARVAAAILRALAKRPTDRFATTRELQDVLLDAGAARRGPSVLPVWRDLPLASSSSEAPTLDHLDRVTGGGPPRGLGAGGGTPGSLLSGSSTEPLDVWKRAVEAFDDEIDAASESADQAASGAQPRARAHATVVLDPLQETARLELARPTRMLEDAPFAAHARSLHAQGERRAERHPAAWLLWTIATATALALALGWVGLRPRDVPPAADAAAELENRARSERAALRAPPRVPEIAAETSARAEPKPAPSSPPRGAAESPRAKRRQPAPVVEPSREPEPRAQEEPGWVIRR
jgi:serine/threonine protein kinase